MVSLVSVGGGAGGAAGAAAGAVGGALPIIEGIFGPFGAGRQAADQWVQGFQNKATAQLGQISTPDQLLSWYQNYMQQAQRFISTTNGGDKIIAQNLFNTPAFAQTIDTIWKQVGGPQQYGISSLMGTIGTQAGDDPGANAVQTAIDTINQIPWSGNPYGVSQGGPGSGPNTQPTNPNGTNPSGGSPPATTTGQPGDPGTGTGAPGTGSPGTGAPGMGDCVAAGTCPTGPAGPGTGSGTTIPPLPPNPTTGAPSPGLPGGAGDPNAPGNRPAAPGKAPTGPLSFLQKYAPWLLGLGSIAGNLIGANLQANAASDAAKIYAGAVTQSNTLQKAVLQQQMANQAPWMQTGRNALNSLSYMEGLGHINTAPPTDYISQVQLTTPGSSTPAPAPAAAPAPAPAPTGTPNPASNAQPSMPDFNAIAATYQKKYASA